MKSAIVLFVKNLRPGNVKTRIAKETGDGAALTIYQRLLHHTMLVCSAVAFDRFVYYSDSVVENDLFAIDEYQKRLQTKGDLGAKMKSAMEQTFSSGYEKICLIGSDCLALTPAILFNAFESLDNYDVVLGPAVDGGYYLIGMNNAVKPLFDAVEWSTAEVFDQTIERIVEQQLSYCLLPVLSDVDTFNDLPEAWKQEFTSKG